MDADARFTGNADFSAEWAQLRPGQEAEIREHGRPGGTGIIDSLSPDASVVWVRVDGHAPRRMYLAGDPVDILPAMANPDAY